MCGETETTLSIRDVTGDDAGQYYCVVENAACLVGSGTYEFDGDDNVAISRMIQDDFAICAWVQTTQTICNTGSDWWAGADLVNGEMPGHVSHFGLQLLGSKACAAVHSFQLACETDVNNDAWHHLAFGQACSPGQMKLYVDGRMEVEGTGNTVSPTMSTGLHSTRRAGSCLSRLNQVHGST